MGVKENEKINLSYIYKNASALIKSFNAKALFKPIVTINIRFERKVLADGVTESLASLRSAALDSETARIVRPSWCLFVCFGVHLVDAN